MFFHFVVIRFKFFDLVFCNLSSLNYNLYSLLA